MANADDEATIVLSGIGNELSESILKTMYSPYGPVVRIRHNGSNSAQIIFEQRKHAMSAVKATNGAVVYGKALKVSLQRKFKKTSEPCRGFAAGICRQGDLCKYYHVTDNAMYATSTPVVPNPRHEAKQKALEAKAPKRVEPVATDIPPTQLCRHFIRGFCANGSACAFAHVMGLAKDVLPVGKVAKLCQFYVNGLCDRGDACKYVHTPQANPVPEKAIAAPVATSKELPSDEVPDQITDTRTCIECEKPGRAVWQCAKCDNSLYCDECNSSVHQARVMARHKRIKLSPIQTLPCCGECEATVASVQCEQCNVPFCASCDARVHKFKSLSTHARATLLDIVGTAHLTKSFKSKKEQPINTEKPSVVQSATLAKVGDPVPYVESVPRLEFSSDGSSESECEDVQPRTGHGTFEEEAKVMDNAVELESEDDLRDVGPKKKSRSEDNVGDKATAMSMPLHTSKSKQKLSSDSQRLSEEGLASNSARIPVYKQELSSESDEEIQTEAQSASFKTTPFQPIVKNTKKAVSKGVFALHTQQLSSSTSSKHKDPPAKPAVTPAPTAHPSRVRAYNGGISEGSSHTVVKKINEFRDSNQTNELHLDATLNGFERLLAHDCAERLGLSHESVGSGLERHIIISRSGSKRAAVETAGYGHKAIKIKRRQ